MRAPRIDYFVSSHGFGHAARAAAVIAEVQELQPQLRVRIVTSVPRYFFQQSLSGRFEYRRAVTDVGMVQRGPLAEDAAATAVALAEFWSGLPETARAWTRGHEPAPALVVSDISALGLEVARRWGVPSILVENFTWDWIYAAYLNEEPQLQEFAQRYAELVDTVNLRVQTRPYCVKAGGAVEVSPVAREPGTGTTAVRRALGMAEDPRPLVLLTMGGMGWGREAEEDLPVEYLFVALGGSEELHRGAT